MNYHSKLRWSMGLYYPVVIFSSYIFAILEIMVRKYLDEHGTDTRPFPYLTYLLVGLFFIIMGIIQWKKYRLWIYPIAGVIIGILCFQAPAFFSHEFSIYKVTYAISFLVLVLFIIVNWNAFYGQERFEINSRRLFRLAAELISDTGDGFTERPFSAGKVEFTRDELQGFSRFLNGKYVVRSFPSEDKIVFAFSMNKSLVHLDDPKEVSHAIFGYDGNVSVTISEKDYREYVARFSFDRLCESMSTVFKRFLQYYREGMEQRIITELKTAR